MVELNQAGTYTYNPHIEIIITLSFGPLQCLPYLDEQMGSALSLDSTLLALTFNCSAPIDLFYYAQTVPFLCN